VDEGEGRSEGESGRAPRLLEALRERLRYMHYSLRTEEAYVYWVRGFVRWSGQRHPRAMGAAEVSGFLTMLASERRVAAATHRQALSALLFLYREVLGVEMPWLQQLGRPVPPKRIPVVLTHVEVQALLAQMCDGVTGLLGRLLYGTGMRLLEGVRLRVKDFDFVRQVIVVRDGKGGKDRVVMLPRALEAPLRAQFARAYRLWQEDREQGRGGVHLPHALAVKFKRATVQQLLGHADVSTTMIYTHVLKWAAAGTASPLDDLMLVQARVDPSALRAREPFLPCYRVTPSFTAAATSAS
jgi:site-specific recombinase XerD